MTPEPLLLKGKIMHQRFFPKQNQFNYNSHYISVPLAQIAKLKKTFFSLNKFNLFSFHNKDYGDKNQQPINLRIHKILAQNNIDNISQIILITHPRLLGYVFNPVSFWLCLDQNHNLIAVLSEVNNTCGQKHNYLCFKNDLSPIANDEWLSAKKEFYVSPFMAIEGEYKFKFSFIDNKLNFFINYIVDDKLKLSTSLKCSFKKFSNFNLILNFITMPFFTLKTIVLIHYQALKLFLKSIKYYKCPKPLKNNLTINNHEK